MSDVIQVEHFKKALFMLLDETFDNVQGMYLDKGTSMFETLETISAEEASVPVGGKCATLAAQVKHTAFYLQTIDQMVRGQLAGRPDWGQIWREVSAVDGDEWAAIKVELRESYEGIKQLIEDTPAWSDERIVGGPIGMIAHTAYHLGEIRQALCVIKG